MAPITRYARSGDASVAYQVFGEGELDLLFLPGWISQVEQLWEAPAVRRFLERLAAFTRLILFDRRGSGLSDGLLETHTLEQEAEDALAVLDAAGSERAALFTYSLGGFVGALLAAERPERISALIMYASVARTTWAPDYDWAMTREEREQFTEQSIVGWGELDSSRLSVLAPTVAGDPAMAGWFSRLQRLAAGPGEARTIFRAAIDLDVREMLPRIRVPTLVMHRPRELARALLTLMFTDIVDATARAAELGDGRWRDLLARHDEMVREELSRFGGRAVKTVGDGFLATLAGPPSRALRCALAITGVARELGIEVRVGVHTGECELIGEDVGGMAVHIASRVTDLAGPGEVLVSGTVFGTVVGGPFEFEERGLHELKGVPGRWPVFALGA